MSLLCRFESVQWYQLGLAFRVPEYYLEELKEYSEKECLTEVLKYWLRNHNGQPTWQEIDEVQERVTCMNIKRGGRRWYMEPINECVRERKRASEHAGIRIDAYEWHTL